MSEAPAPYQLAPAPLTVAERICLRRAAEGATPGLWMHVHEEGEDEPHYVAQHPGPGSHVGLHYVAEMEPCNSAAANAAFIAEACPRTILRLLDEAATLEAQVRELQERNAMLGGALNDERRDSAAVVTEFRELRSKLTSLFEDFSNGCLPALGERGKATTPYWLAVNSERARNLEWAQLKCKELGIAWPIRPIPYGGISAAPEQPQQPAPQGGGRVGASCPNCSSTDWEELAPGVGCNHCQGL